MILYHPVERLACHQVIYFIDSLFFVFLKHQCVIASLIIFIKTMLDTWVFNSVTSIVDITKAFSATA